MKVRLTLFRMGFFGTAHRWGEAKRPLSLKSVTYSTIMKLGTVIITIQCLVQCCPRGSRQHYTGKILFNVVLILLGQHRTGKSFAQCCPRCSRQHWTEKNPVQCCLNNLGTTFHRQKLCAMLSKKLQTTLHRKKSCSMLS